MTVGVGTKRDGIWRVGMQNGKEKENHCCDFTSFPVPLQSTQVPKTNRYDLVCFPLLLMKKFLCPKVVHLDPDVSGMRWSLTGKEEEWDSRA